MFSTLTYYSVSIRHYLIAALFIFFTTTGFAQQAVFTWGENANAQLGDGIFDYTGAGQGWYTTPQPMTCYDDWKTLAASDLSILGIRENGTLWTWGASKFLGLVAEFPLGVFNIQSVARQIGTDDDWKFVSTSSFTNLAIKTDGSLWAWGINDVGGVGDGTYTDVAAPKRIGVDANWATAHVSSNSCFGIKKDGTLWGWGDNSDGILGIGSTSANVLSPRLVNTDLDWEKLATGNIGFSMAAIKTDGSLWTWGSNISGMLGLGLAGSINGNSVIVTSPTRVGTGSDWKTVSASRLAMVALKTDGSLWTWGGNDYGILGDGGSDRNIPQRVGTDTDWESISVSNNMVIATKTDGSLWVWGNNTLYNSWGIPVRIGADTGWNSAVAGSNFFAVLKDVPFDPVPVALDLGQDIRSCQPTATLQSSITDAALYKWTTPDGSSTGQATLHATTPGTYKLTITKSGCRSTDEVNFNVNSNQGTFAIEGTPIVTCVDTYDISKPLRLVNQTGLTSSVTWSWGNGETTSAANPQYTYPQPGRYTITMEGECGLRADQVVDVLPILSLGDDRTVCQPPLPLTGNISAADQYTWLLPDGTNATQPTYNATQPGTYTLTIKQAGCAQTDDIVILFESDEPGSFTATSAGIVLEDHATILAGMPVTFNNTNPAGGNYAWDLGNGESSAELRMEYTYPEAGEYRVTLTGKTTAGCVRFAEKTIRVEDLVITDAISPNGDGKNDQLRIAPLLYEAELIVTDQNGRTVFNAAPYRDDFTGSGLETGVYYYQVKLKGTGTSYKGFIHIIR
jgi:alpha-tubulin suppressor-like RCC1 family protein